mmetsp:Transcript_13325/g.38264  ORF Transcript_13325/g.38264 Transcript_13325/m.38264 type:complete len:89 (+) Transcript_13325:313-579(+)
METIKHHLIRRIMPRPAGYSVSEESRLLCASPFTVEAVALAAASCACAISNTAGCSGILIRSNIERYFAARRRLFASNALPSNWSAAD